MTGAALFGIVLLTVCTLMLLYVLLRAASVPLVARRVPRKALACAGLLLWAGLLLARTLGHDARGALAAGMEYFGMTAMVVLFLTSVCLLAADLVTAFGFLLKRWVPWFRARALVGGLALSAVALVQGLRPPVVRPYEVRLPGLPAELDGTVAVAISDTHLGTLLGERWLAARVEQVRAEKPDLVVLLGDLFEGHGRPPEAFLEDLKGLSAPLGVWAVTGNHESHGSRDASVALLEEAGCQVLHDRWVQLRPGLMLAGVDDLTSRRRRGQGGDTLAKALEGRPAGATVLLSHSPWQYDEAATSGVGLMLCGHTHGGQVWPFNYVVRLYYPLVDGRYQVGGMTVIVGRGTGTWGPRMRLWGPGEILRITLRSPGV